MKYFIDYYHGTEQHLVNMFPIPAGLKLWFGDEYILTKLLKNGWKLMRNEVVAYHYGSLGIRSNKEAGEIIKQDKAEWGKIAS